MSSNLFFSMNPLDACFISQSHNPGKLTFVNVSFWEKRAAIPKLRRPFNFDLKTHPPHTILREVSRISSLILRAKPWLAKKVLRHGNFFAACVCRRYFRRERSDDRECVCCLQASIWVAYLLIELFYICMPVVRTDDRSVGRSVITKFSRMGRLPHFLSHGAPPTRGEKGRASSSAKRDSWGSGRD